MSKAKKFLLIAFTVGLVINLQFNAPLTRNMDNGFSIEQLAENIFVPEAFATFGNIKHYYNFYLPCFTNGHMGHLIDCDPGGQEFCNAHDCE